MCRKVPLADVITRNKLQEGLIFKQRINNIKGEEYASTRIDFARSMLFNSGWLRGGTQPELPRDTKNCNLHASLTNQLSYLSGPE